MTNASPVYTALAVVGGIGWLIAFTLFIWRRHLFPIKGRDWFLSSIFSLFVEVGVVCRMVMSATENPCHWAAFFYSVTAFFVVNFTAAHVTRTWTLLSVARQRWAYASRKKRSEDEKPVAHKKILSDEQGDDTPEDNEQGQALADTGCKNVVAINLKEIRTPVEFTSIKPSWLVRHAHWFTNKYLIGVSVFVAIILTAWTTGLFVKHLGTREHVDGDPFDGGCEVRTAALIPLTIGTVLVMIPLCIGAFKLWGLNDGYKLKNELKGIASAGLIWIVSYIVQAVTQADNTARDVDVQGLILWCAYHQVTLFVLVYPLYLSFTSTDADGVKRSSSGQIKRARLWRKKNKARSRTQSMSGKSTSSSENFTLGHLLHDPDYDLEHRAFTEYLVSTFAIEGYLFYLGVCNFQEDCALCPDIADYSVDDVLAERKKFNHTTFGRSIPMLSTCAAEEAPIPAAAPEETPNDNMSTGSEHSREESAAESSKASSEQLRDELGLSFMNMPDEGKSEKKPLANARSVTLMAMAAASSSDVADLNRICQWAVGLYCEFILTSGYNRANFPSQMVDDVKKEMHECISNLESVVRRWKNSHSVNPTTLKLQIERAPSPRMFDNLKANAFEIMKGDPFVRFTMPDGEYSRSI